MSVRAALGRGMRVASERGSSCLGTPNGAHDSGCAGYGSANSTRPPRRTLVLGSAEASRARKERLEFGRRAGGTYWPRRSLQPCANLEVPRAGRTSDIDVKIISRYILREHVGPFFFALTALTSLMILNFISRQFGELVGKGLPASVIA